MTSGETSAKRSWRTLLLPLAVTAALVIPNIVVIALGTEDFPFTTAPMFAHYVGPETELYAFRLEGVTDGVAEPFPISETNLNVIEFQRQFATWFYRPMTDTAPFRDLSGASSTLEGLEETLAGYFGSLTDFLRDHRGIEYDSIVLYVDVVDSTGLASSTEQVGTYDTATRRYIQTYTVDE